MNIVPPEVEEYMRGLASRYDEPVLLEMEEYAKQNGFPVVGRLCGVTLEILARAVGARRVFELGSGYGYSGYWFSRAVGPDGEVHLSDGDPENQKRARGYLERAGVWERVRYHVGDALTCLSEADGAFDVVYCDVDKQGYPDCWRAARDRVRVGGLYVCDNTLWTRRVADESNREPETVAIREHNRLIARDADYVAMINPTRDGLMVALRLG